AAQARRQADDEQARIERPEGMHRSIVPVRFLRAPLMAEGDETRTKRDIERRLGFDRFPDLDRLFRFFALSHFLPANRRTRPDQVRGLRKMLVFVELIVRGAGALRRGRPLQELRRVAAFALAPVAAIATIA